MTTLLILTVNVKTISIYLHSTGTPSSSYSKNKTSYWLPGLQDIKYQSDPGKTDNISMF